MVKTLRITSILIAVLAVAILALPVVSGADTDSKKTKKDSGFESVVEKFKKTEHGRTAKSADQTPPLIKEAKAFALYLNPPKPKVQRAQSPVIPRTDRAIPPVISIPRNAQFNLIGTCIHQSDPNLSVALIDVLGKDQRWVRQSEAVGHLIIKKIKQGSVVINDGTRTYELPMIAKPVEKSLVVGKTTSDQPTPEIDSETILSDIIKSQGERVSGKPLTEPKRFSQKQPKAVRTAPDITPEQEEFVKKFMEEIGQLPLGEDASGIKIQESFEKFDAMMEKYLSDIENMRISGKEEEKLNNLGKELDNIKKDPNQPK